MLPHRRTLLLSFLLPFRIGAADGDMWQELNGKVVDSRGQAVAGAAVKLKEVATLRIRSAISEKGGGFHFNGLNKRYAYEVWADYKGAESDRKYLSRFKTGETLNVTLTVSPSRE